MNASGGERQTRVADRRPIAGVDAPCSARAANLVARASATKVPKAL